MIDPELKPFLADWANKWSRASPGASVQARRALFETIALEMRLPTPEDIDTDAQHWIESSAGRVRVRVFRHRSGGVQPCLVYMHGGAWMQGSPETHWDITARIASRNKQTVISVDYAKAPEHPFPAGLNQCADVLRWAVAQTAALGIDPQRLAVGGDSAGANLAAALTLMFRDQDITLMAQMLVYPAVEFTQSRPSFRENPDGPIIRVADMPMVNRQYCADPAHLTHPLAAPLLASDHGRLPPAYIAVAEHDPLRDDGIAYAKALESAGVSVTLDRGTGLIHGYLRALDYCAASRDSLRHMSDWLARQNEASHPA